MRVKVKIFGLVATLLVIASGLSAIAGQLAPPTQKLTHLGVTFNVPADWPVDRGEVSGCDQSPRSSSVSLESAPSRSPVDAGARSGGVEIVFVCPAFAYNADELRLTVRPLDSKDWNNRRLPRHQRQLVRAGRFDGHVTIDQRQNELTGETARVAIGIDGTNVEFSFWGTDESLRRKILASIR